MFRLFSCGTSKDGDIFLVEWNENEGSVKRKYSGLTNKAVGTVQFDAANNRFLAAGADNQIKFWDVDSSNVLMEINAEGGLPVSIVLYFRYLDTFFAKTI